MIAAEVNPTAKSKGRANIVQGRMTGVNHSSKKQGVKERKHQNSDGAQRYSYPEEGRPRHLVSSPDTIYQLY